MNKSRGARMLVALLIATSLTGGSAQVGFAEGNVEQRIAEFWKRVDALRPADHLSAKDLGQWALNVIERDRAARIAVAEFRASTAAMQTALERAGPAGTPAQPPVAGIEQRIAEFWKRIDALQATDHLSAEDLGRWALNVIERDSRARITVADFGATSARMQTGIDAAPRAPVAPAPTPTAPSCASTGAPASTGLEGRVTWNGAGVAGHRVEIRENLHQIVDVFYPDFGGLQLGSGTTDATGRFRITGLPVKPQVVVWMPEQGLYQGVGYGVTEYPLWIRTCGNKVIDIGDVSVSGMITGISIANGATVSAGPRTITWAAVPSATTYCVTIFGWTGGDPRGPVGPWDQELASGTCVGGYGPWAASTVTTPSFTTTLKAGSVYTLQVYAVAGSRQIAASRVGYHSFVVP